MGANLRLGEGGRLREGLNGKETPSWYWVEGLPDGRRALLRSQGNPNNRWVIERTPPVDQDKERTFATAEDALGALQQEIG